jgi:pyruvate dehydrogenase E2 component (dihydrolipoamide acetyltransferase)
MSLMEVRVPDIGDFKSVPVIEILVKVGETVKVDDPLVSLESDKATMEVPAPSAGVVSEIIEGSVIILLQAGTAGPKPGSAAAKAATAAAATAAAAPSASPSPTTGVFAPVKGSATPPPKPFEYGGVHASPSVRRLARELDIDLLRLKGTGEKGRISKDDVKSALKGAGAATLSGGGAGIPEIPAIDFSKFGTIETKPLPRIKRVSGPHLHRAWLNIPHVTHSDEADITELEDFRKKLDTKGKDTPKEKGGGYRVTMLSFLIKAAIGALKEYPMLNASLAPDKENLIYKKYYNIGVAVDTPDGLVVPVIKDADRKGILELSQELGMLSKKMRDGKFTPADISGGSFSISSLGGIGGTHFTPIVNAPEVAILGVVRSTMRPHWNGKTFEPRLILPLCLSYDHRVIDGALAARFTRHLAGILEDVRQLVL